MAWSTTINSSQTTNPANNTSTVFVSLTFSAINQGYSGYNTSFVLYVGGNLVANAAGPSALNTDGAGTDTWTSGTYSYTFTHDANTGTRGAVGTSGTFYGSGGFSPPASGVSGTGTTYGALDYDRSPTTPTISSVVRSSDGSQITTFNFSGGVNNSGPTVTYTYEYATDSGMSQNYGTASSLPFSLPSATTAYYFRVKAVNADGTKYSSVTSIRPGVPTAPASLTYVKTGRNVALTATASSGSGGGTISSYSVQYRTSSDGGSNWGSWGNTQTMTSLQYTYSLLPPALTYDFRVFSTNELGNSLTTSIAAPFFVAAGGKRWNGTAFVATQTAKRWTGTAWIDLTVAKRWNGSSWVDLS